ncbi:MAG: NAD(+) diphosphatase [Pseudomonadota bacterium]
MKPNYLAGGYISREAHLRIENFDTLISGGSVRFLPLVGKRICLDSESRVLFLPPDSGLLSLSVHHIYLGKFQNSDVVALDFDRPMETKLQEVGVSNFVDLRTAAVKLERSHASLVAYAAAMIKWHKRTQFCGVCGAKTQTDRAGHLRTCPDCGAQHFPRLDPAIIVLVTDGHNCLLGRQPSWDQGRYSTIAGFVEPGESLEDAVMREVMEETGVSTDDIRYHSSQPWPFPSSLMLGFYANATSSSINLGDDELEDAQWFSKDDIKQGRVKLPYRVSISFRLIEDWFNQNEPVPLREIVEPF